LVRQSSHHRHRAALRSRRTVCEFGVFSSPWPDEAEGDVVHAVSCLSADPVVVWAEAALTPITAAKIAAATQIIFISNG
jgi:hypothetical protein